MNLARPELVVFYLLRGGASFALLGFAVRCFALLCYVGFPLIFFTLCLFTLGIFGIFSKYLAKWGLFSKYVEKVPLAPPSAAPPRPEEGVFFQNIWKLYPIFFLKTCQI
jgi:hypothetical protein